MSKFDSRARLSAALNSSFHIGFLWNEAFANLPAFIFVCAYCIHQGTIKGTVMQRPAWRLLETESDVLRAAIKAYFGYQCLNLEVAWSFPSPLTFSFKYEYSTKPTTLSPEKWLLGSRECFLTEQHTGWWGYAASVTWHSLDVVLSCLLQQDICIANTFPRECGVSHLLFPFSFRPRRVCFSRRFCYFVNWSSSWQRRSGRNWSGKASAKWQR